MEGGREGGRKKRKEGDRGREGGEKKYQRRMTEKK